MDVASRLLCIVTSLLLTACRSAPTPVPLAAPPVRLRVAYHWGTGLSGPVAAPSAAAAALADVDDVACTLWYCAPFPHALAPVAMHAGVIAALGEQPFTAIPQAASAICVANGAEADAFARALGDHRRCVPVEVRGGALVRGATTTFATDSGEAGGTATGCAIALSRDAGGSTQTALQIDGETIVLDAALAAPITLVVLLPAAPASTEPAWFVYVVRGATAHDSAARLAAVTALAPRAEAPAGADAGVGTGAANDRALDATIAVALQGMPSRPVRRSGLAWLAETTGAIAAGDAVLAADDDWLAQLAHALASDRQSASTPRAALGLWLERGTLAFLAEQLDRGQLPAELESVLLRHTGALGRLPAALLEALAAATDLDALRARLVAENRQLLRDTSPAARARAFAWLQARGLAPAGFDPLADKAARRAALERAAHGGQP